MRYNGKKHFGGNGVDRSKLGKIILLIFGFPIAL